MYMHMYDASLFAALSSCKYSIPLPLMSKILVGTTTPSFSGGVLCGLAWLGWDAFLMARLREEAAGTFAYPQLAMKAADMDTR